MRLWKLWRGAARPISLALQGGGAHGAFTWGVLDALLEREDLRLAALSGTSAGAMNAIVTAHGLLHGGRDGAREALAAFWAAVSTKAPVGWFTTKGETEAPTLVPAAHALLQFARLLSPYVLNPMNVNPLREVLAKQVDFERLRRDSKLPLFVAATNANTGQLRLFRRHELSIEAALASACLPTVMHAVEIDGQPYWDGAYSGNPALFPLILEAKAADMMIVTLSPHQHGGLPRTIEQIQTRAAEIAFNSSFLREVRLLAGAQAMALENPMRFGRLERRLADLRFHLIEAQEHLAEVPGESRMIAHLPFLEALRDLGRSHTQAWLKQNSSAIGERSSVDLNELFGEPVGRKRPA
jgi:NTE family protein